MLRDKHDWLFSNHHTFMPFQYSMPLRACNTWFLRLSFVAISLVVTWSMTPFHHRHCLCVKLSVQLHVQRCHHLCTSDNECSRLRIGLSVAGLYTIDMVRVHKRCIDVSPRTVEYSKNMSRGRTAAIYLSLWRCSARKRFAGYRF